MSKMRLSYGRLSGRDAARLAKPVYVCARPNCEVHHQPVRFDETVVMGTRIKVKHRWRQPDHCISCGGMVFDYFPSEGEANYWAALRLQQKVGHITDLQRQVKIPLYANAPNGMKVHVADYLADATYTRVSDGQHVIGDHKPETGMDREAKLKLKWVEAQLGVKVTIHT